MRPAWLEIDLDAYAHNVAQIRGHVGPERGLIAVVKANAYAHGAVAIGHCALAGGAQALAVALLQEAVELRQAGIAAPLLVLGAGDGSDADGFVEHDVMPAVATIGFARALSEAAARQGKTALCHVKLDTGMGRQGVRPDEVAGFGRSLLALSNLRVSGVFSHFADSATDEAFTRQQRECFVRGAAALEGLMATAEGGGSPQVAAAGDGAQAADPWARHAAAQSPLLWHLANSGAVAFHPDCWLDAVRPGGLCYGIPRYDRPCPVQTQQVMTLKARVVTVKSLRSGDSVGYDRTFIATGPTRTAVLPLGYADGYPRSAGGKAQVLVRGRRCPVLGRVSMDCIVIDVTAIDGCAEGEEVVLLGRQGDEAIATAELASWAGSCVEETAARFTSRLRRVYLGGGRTQGG